MQLQTEKIKKIKGESMHISKGKIIRINYSRTPSKQLGETADAAGKNS